MGSGKKTYKYIRKYKNKKGNWTYVYGTKTVRGEKSNKKSLDNYKIIDGHVYTKSGDDTYKRKDSEGNTRVIEDTDKIFSSEAKITTGGSDTATYIYKRGKLERAAKAGREWIKGLFD